jgi:SNF2 family DNA or RNA helicase
MQSEFTFTNGRITCALCREKCSQNESYLVNNNKRETKKTLADKEKNLIGMVRMNVDEDYYNTRDKFDLDHVKIKGKSNSAKVEGVVKCLVKILSKENSAKCLVFSENVSMLELINDLLDANSIGYRYIKYAASINKHIRDFKNMEDINVLVMPYSYGANGLNLIEATHVLLVEPTLNMGQEVQAIGRVHRIGQDKPTFVYRFLVKNTIEQLVYDLFRAKSSYEQNSGLADNQPICSKNIGNEAPTAATAAEKYITLNDIKKLFLNL